MCLSQISFFPLIWHLNRGVFDILTSHIHYIDTFSNTQSFPKYVFQYPDLKKLEQVLAKLWQDDILAWVVLLQVAPRDSCLFYHFGQFCLMGQVWKWSRNDVAFFLAHNVLIQGKIDAQIYFGQFWTILPFWPGLKMVQKRCCLFFWLTK